MIGSLIRSAHDDSHAHRVHLRSCVAWLIVPMICAAGLLFNSSLLPAQDATVDPFLELAEEIAPSTGEDTVLPGLTKFTDNEFHEGRLTGGLLAAVAGVFLFGGGLVLFYCGLGNVQQPARFLPIYLVFVSIMSIAWVAWGYSPAFARNVHSLDAVLEEIEAPDGARTRGNRLIGGADHLGLRGLQSQMEVDSVRYPLRRPYDRYPHLLFMIFQMSLFIAAPAPLIVLLFDRLRLLGTLCFCLLWGSFVYTPVAYWLWGGGWLTDTLDFAGGLVIHTTVGITGLALGLVGKQPQTSGHAAYEEVLGQSTNLAWGATLVWAGGLLAYTGHALHSDGIAVNAFVVAHLTAATGVVGWTGMRRMFQFRLTPAGACMGVVAGLAGGAAACGSIGPQSALIVGTCAGAIAAAADMCVRRCFGNNTLLRLFAIQGVPGMAGTMLVAIFATSAVAGNDRHGNPITSWLAGDTALLAGQSKALACVVLLTVAGSLLALTLSEGIVGVVGYVTRSGRTENDAA